MNSPIHRDQIKRCLAILAIFSAFAHCLLLSWNQWGELVVDFGRDLEVSNQILNGKVLYRDLRYYYGPFTPYFNALLFAMFGVHLNVLVTAGIASAALVCFFLYRIARLLLDRLESTAIVILFVYTCVFTKLSLFVIFSFASPYTYATVYGLAAALGSLYCLLRHYRKRKLSDYFWSLGFLMLTAFCKPEVLLPAVAIQCAFFLLNVNQNLVSRHHIVAFIFTCLSIASGYGILSWITGPGLFSDNLFGPGIKGSGDYILLVMGILDWQASLKEGQSSALTFILVPLFAYVLYWGSLHKSGKVKKVTSVAALAVGFGAYFFMSAELAFRFLPLFLGIAMVVMVWQWRKDHALRPALFPRIIIILFALSCLVRIILKVSAHHFGFYLMPAGLLALGIIFYGGMGQSMNDRTKRIPEFKFAGLGLFIALAFCHFNNNSIGYSLKTTDFKTPRGNLKLMEATSNGIPWGVEFVKLNRMLSGMPQNTRVMVVPQGVGITFFSGQKHDFPMYSFLPMEFNAKYSEGYVLELLKANSPDVIVRLEWPMQEFGSARIWN